MSLRKAACISIIKMPHYLSQYLTSTVCLLLTSMNTCYLWDRHTNHINFPTFSFVVTVDAILQLKNTKNLDRYRDQDLYSQQRENIYPKVRQLHLSKGVSFLCRNATFADNALWKLWFVNKVMSNECNLSLMESVTVHIYCIVTIMRYWYWLALCF